jgi:hypothetical protein
MQRIDRRGRLEVRNALRDGRAVNEQRLAALAAAVAQDQMSRIDYRGPLLRQEKIMVLAVIAEIALAAAVGLRDLGATFSSLGASTIVVFWVVGLRRVTPSHRQPTDRLLTAYRANRTLADNSPRGELDRIQLGMP